MGFKHNDKLYHVAPTYWAEDTKGGWSFQFGAYGSTRIIVLNEPGISSLADALESAAEVIDNVAPGVWVSKTSMNDAYKEAIAEGMSEEDAQAEAETDMTYTESGWIPSWEWHVNELHSGPLFDKAQAYAIEHEDD